MIFFVVIFVQLCVGDTGSFILILGVLGGVAGVYFREGCHGKFHRDYTESVSFFYMMVIFTMINLPTQSMRVFSFF